MRPFSILRPALLLAAALASGLRAAGPMAYVGNFKDNSVSVIDTARGVVVSTIPVAAGPHGLAASRDGRSLYVSSDGSSLLSVLDTATNRVTRTIEVGREPHGLALTPDGRELLVAVNGEDRVAFVDTAKDAVVASIPVPKPHTISIRPDGQVAYVASQVPEHPALVVIDLARRLVLRALPLAKVPRDIEFGYDGRSLYFTQAGRDAVDVLDTTTDKVVTEIPTGTSPHYASAFRGARLGMAVVQGPGELFLFDPATNRPLRSIPVGRQPHWLAVSRDGRTAYVTDEGADDVTIIDLASGATSSIPVGHQPRKILLLQPVGGGGLVTIDRFAFSPAELTIAPGGTVTWSNQDGAPHAIGFKDGAPASGTLLPGTTFQRTFELPGTYEYFCSLHNYMTGRIIVRSQ